MCWSRLKEEVARAIERDGLAEVEFGDPVELGEDALVPCPQTIVPVTARRTDGRTSPVGFFQQIDGRAVFAATGMPAGAILAEDDASQAREAFLARLGEVVRLVVGKGTHSSWR
jgi:hypothetical protein